MTNPVNPVTPSQTVLPASASGAAASPPAATPGLAMPDPPPTTSATQPTLTLVPPQASTLTPPAATMPLVSTVGEGGRNRTDDVKAVQQRLRELGFPVGVDGRMGPQTESFIRIFAAAVENQEILSKASARLGPNDRIGKKLFAADAPRWVEIPESGVGFLRVDTDGYGYGTDRAVAVIEAAGRYFADHYALSRVDTFPIKINDVSKKDGSVVARNGRIEHDSHRSGLDIDVGLPKKPGSEKPEGGTRTNWENYDREAAYAVITAFAHQDSVERIILYDRNLEERARREGMTWVDKLVQDSKHRSHFHVDVVID